MVRHFPRLASVVVGLFGVLILVSWQAHWRIVLQILPTSAPTHYNTAICFILTSAGLFLLTTQRAKIATWLGGIIVGFALLTFLQYVTGRDLYIDQILSKPFFELNSIHPGRMSLLTAFCFILVGTGIFLAGVKKAWSYRLAVAGLLACIVTMIACVAFFGYVFGIEAAYSWGASAQMTVNSSIAFFLLSNGLLVWSWQTTRREHFNFLRWLPITWAVTLMVMITFISTVNLVGLKNATAERRHTFQVILKTQAFEDNLIDIQRGARGYAILADTNALVSYKTSAALEPQLFTELIILTDDNPELQPQLKSLAATMKSIFAYDQRLIAVYENEGLAAAVKLDASGENRRLFGSARDVLKIVSNAEQRLLDVRDAAEQKGSDNATHLLVLGSVAAALLLLFANQMANRELRQRQQAEDRLRVSEERFRLALDSAPIGMSLVSPEGRWMKVNHALCHMLGYPETELLATTFQQITHPEDLEKDLDYVRQMLAGRILSYQMEKRYFHKNGTIVQVMLSVALVRDRLGEPIYFVSQIENISERRQREVEREKLIGELQKALAEVKSLSGMIPICGWCKNVRSDEGYWQSVEQYVRAHSDADFSHGMCPSCTEKFKAEIAAQSSP